MIFLILSHGFKFPVRAPGKTEVLRLGLPTCRVLGFRVLGF